MTGFELDAMFKINAVPVLAMLVVFLGDRSQLLRRVIERAASRRGRRSLEYCQLLSRHNTRKKFTEPFLVSRPWEFVIIGRSKTRCKSAGSTGG